MGRARMVFVFSLLGVLFVTAAAPIALGSTTTYLTSTLAPAGAGQATINGYNGVLANYTSSASTRMGGFVYLDLANSANQTVYWNVAYCSFAGSQNTQCFVVISSTVPKGNYTASVFAATNSSIPISTTSSFSVKI